MGLAALVAGAAPHQDGTPSGAAPHQDGTPSVAGRTAVAGAELIDINHATLEELKTLPGVGDAYSLKIVKHRPYKNKTQLRSKGVLSAAAYKKIKDYIIAKQ